ncbi:hypothetical protein LZ32DRAFT_321653 [Colletotrichum eremochloae]|nr:hypothetical protein LZ32DRAFT_321653 [Colletotrichum eremochloae]
MCKVGRRGDDSHSMLLVHRLPGHWQAAAAACLLVCLPTGLSGDRVVYLPILYRLAQCTKQKVARGARKCGRGRESRGRWPWPRRVDKTRSG